MKISKIIFCLIIVLLLLEIIHTTSIAISENQVWDGSITEPSQLIERGEIYYYKITLAQAHHKIKYRHGETSISENANTSAKTTCTTAAAVILNNLIF